MRKFLLSLFFINILFAFTISLGGGGDDSSSDSSSGALSFNAVTSAKNGDAVSDWDNNFTTQVVGEQFTMYVLSKDSNDNSVEANITQVVFMFFNDGNSTDCNGTNEENETLCDDNNSTLPDCADTNSSGEVEMNATINRAARCVQVHIEGQSKSSGGGSSDSGGSSWW